MHMRTLPRTRSRLHRRIGLLQLRQILRVEEEDDLCFGRVVHDDSQGSLIDIGSADPIVFIVVICCLESRVRQLRCYSTFSIGLIGSKGSKRSTSEIEGERVCLDVHQDEVVLRWSLDCKVQGCNVNVNSFQWGNPLHSIYRLYFVG